MAEGKMEQSSSIMQKEKTELSVGSISQDLPPMTHFL